MSAAPLDRHRQAVYDAEDVAFGGTVYDDTMPFADAADLIDAFCAGDWWESLALPVPVVVPTRRDSNRSYARGRNGGSARPSIHLAPGGCTVATVAHELAHVLVHVLGPPGEPHHGPAFRSADVSLVAELVGPAAADRLDSAFTAAGLPLGPRLVVESPSASLPNGGFWPGWRAARILAEAAPAPRRPIAL